MVKRSTWILLILLALVVGAYFLLAKHPFKTAEPTPTTNAPTYLVNQTEGALQSLRIFDNKGHSVKLQQDLSKTWVITAPTSGVADQGLASAAVTQVGALKIVAILDTPPALGEIGLDAPANTLELVFPGGASHKIEVGILTPTSSGYYVRYDGGKIYIISQSGIDALLKLLSSPPFPATATPAPTAENTGTITP
jgi:hypothetical protein